MDAFEPVVESEEEGLEEELRLYEEEPNINVPIAEAVQLGAVDADFFYRTFFPKAFRQPSAPFHFEIDKRLDNPTERLVHLRCFRGSAKTTRLRAFTTRRIAYNVSRTILYIGASEDHAVRSVRWVRTQIERNTLFASAFNLTKGNKWTDTELEIYHGVEDEPIWLLGVGITGNIRGINFEDYRPDLIILDDVLTDENTATLEQREKIFKLIHGAVKNSLAPRVDNPNAKLAFLNTPLHIDDASSRAMKDPAWACASFSCWTPETEDLPVEQQVSAWEDRFPTEDLRRDKKSAIFNNEYSIFAKELEVKLVTPELCAFRLSWLNIYKREEGPKPGTIAAILAIDPVPPPSEIQMAKGLKGKDYEVLTVIGRHKGDYYRLESSARRGHDPDWTLAEFFRLARKWKIQRAVIESVAYQRVLKWLIEKEMSRRQLYYSVEAYVDKRPKSARIIGTLKGIAAAGRLWVPDDDARFVTEFSTYSETVKIDHDDELDSTAIGLASFVNPILELGEGDYELLEDEYEPLPFYGGCP